MSLGLIDGSNLSIRATTGNLSFLLENFSVTRNAIKALKLLKYALNIVLSTWLFLGCSLL